MTLPNESQHEPSMCRLVTLASIATLRRKVLAPQCIFQSILGICCHIDAASHEKFTQNIEALKTSMHSSYKSILFFVETCRNIEDWFVCFCSPRIDAWLDSRNYLIEEACSEALGVTSLRKSTSNDSHSHSSIDQESIALRKLARKLQNLHRWESFRTRRSEGASELVALRELQDSSLGELVRKLQASWYLL